MPNYRLACLAPDAGPGYSTVFEDILRLLERVARKTRSLLDQKVIDNGEPVLRLIKER